MVSKESSKEPNKSNSLNPRLFLLYCVIYFLNSDGYLEKASATHPFHGSVAYTPSCKTVHKRCLLITTIAIE